MKRSHKPTKTEPAETSYEFTEEDILEALVLWLESKGEEIPKGERCYFYHHRDSRSERERPSAVVKVKHEILEKQNEA